MYASDLVTTIAAYFASREESGVVEYAPVIFFRVNYSHYTNSVGDGLIEYQEFPEVFHWLHA